MSKMRLETERLFITEFDLSMAEDVQKNSLDDDNRRFVPDEVFETVDDARKTLEYLIDVYRTGKGPLVYPIFLKNGKNVGYVQLLPKEDYFEIGYHIAKNYRCNGYATEALTVFLEYIFPLKQVDKVYGICLFENVASKRVLEKCGFKKEWEGIGIYQNESENIIKFVYYDKR